MSFLNVVRLSQWISMKNTTSFHLQSSFLHHQPSLCNSWKKSTSASFPWKFLFCNREASAKAAFSLCKSFHSPYLLHDVESLIRVALKRKASQWSASATPQLSITSTVEIYIERRAMRWREKKIPCKPGAYFRFCVASKIDFSRAARTQHF